MPIPKKTLEDLEFSSVIESISVYSITSLGKNRIKSLVPMYDIDKINFDLSLVSEYASSLENENNFPNHGFEEISREIKVLQIKNSQLDIDSFIKIKHISELVISHIKFLKKFKTYYGSIYSLTEKLTIEKEIVNEIVRIIDKYGFVKDNASAELQEIRKNLSIVKTKIVQTFSSALRNYNKLGFLDEINESMIDNKRVLAVKSMYRRKVKGQMIGSSKTGGIVYIEPQETLVQSRKHQDLLYDEDQEIKKILKGLTYFISPYSKILNNYQEYLTEIDLIYSKARYANEINGIKPEIIQDKKIKLIEAYHPLLLSSNYKQNIKTFPQSLELNNSNRIVVISGPNAGGKSITLKTIGLLQIMVQSGILIPVNKKSEISIFEQIISDIGDNQSIENQLSTYSYRLKNMNNFLKKCNSNTLFLIDEFGTGSDPELGGALAEIFLEVFYERKSFGIITTHYSNLKLLADELPNMSNANMEFDNNTLEPTFNLTIGSPGSSFTFEVAQKNGIPYSLINRAKKKIQKGKVRFDATIAKLQKQKIQLNKTEKSLKNQEEKLKNENQKLDRTNQKIKDKLINYQELFDSNQKMINVGNKVNDIAQQYFINNKKRLLVSELIKIAETLNSKRKKTNFYKSKIDNKRKKKTSVEVDKDLIRIRKEKKNNNNKKKSLKKPTQVFKTGDKVRIQDSLSVGTIDKIEKNKAILNYGNFTTKVDLIKLELAH